MSAASSDLDCERTEQVLRYALAQLPQADVPSLQQHLAQCDVCRGQLAALRPVIGALPHWPVDVLQPSMSAWERLSKRIAPERDIEPEKSSPTYSEPAWQVVAPGIACKILSRDKNRQRVSMLVRLEPGYSYPAHRHAGLEELHLLEGELWIEDRKLLPGDYNKGQAGTVDHRVWSETGCMCVLITSTDDVLFA